MSVPIGMSKRAKLRHDSKSQPPFPVRSRRSVVPAVITHIRLARPSVRRNTAAARACWLVRYSGFVLSQDRIAVTCRFARRHRISNGLRGCCGNSISCRRIRVGYPVNEITVRWEFAIPMILDRPQKRSCRVRARCCVLAVVVTTFWLAFLKLGQTAENEWPFFIPSVIELPEVQRTDWVRSEVDRFVLRKLEDKQLRPAGCGRKPRNGLVGRLWIGYHFTNSKSDDLMLGRFHV